MDEKQKELLNKLKYLINKKKSFKAICEELKLQPYEIYGLAELLKMEGLAIDIGPESITKITQPIPKLDVYEIPDTKPSDILLLSDTHLGSKCDRVDLITAAYKEAERRGIQTALHAGDISDGYYPNRPQQLYELKTIGADQTTDYIVNVYPHIEGINTYFIAGNHDFTFVRNDGFDIGKAIDRQREDMHYLGPDVANVDIDGLKVRLVHGSKGPAYALSYKLQKYAETIDEIEKPDILMQGHFHNSFYMYYQGMHCFQVPSTIDQTQFARSMGLKNEKGVWFVHLERDHNGKIISITPELYDFNTKTIKKAKSTGNGHRKEPKPQAPQKILKPGGRR